MKLYLSYSQADSSLVRALISHFRKEGLDIVDPNETLLPGENWAERIGAAVAQADGIVLVLTQHSIKSEFVKQDIELALFNSRFRDRVFPLVIGIDTQEVPWILRSFRYFITTPDHLETAAWEIRRAVEKISVTAE